MQDEEYEQIRQQVIEAALRAKACSQQLASASDKARQEALIAMAAGLKRHTQDVLDANEIDMAVAAKKGMKPSLLDRLRLDEGRIIAMADSLVSLSKLPDVVGRTLDDRILDNGLHLRRVSVPLGLVGMIYEARPNVTADAIGICVRTGNGCILRGGSAAMNSNEAIAAALREALCAYGFDSDCIQLISIADRRASDALMSLRGIVDVLIPRGGAGLIRNCVEHSMVPVIETGTGNCHIYLHESADLQKAIPIIINAKTQRIGVCNAAESIIVDESAAAGILPAVMRALADAGVRMHCDDVSRGIAEVSGQDFHDLILPGDEEDWGTEYLDMDISICCVHGVKDAIDHINRYSTHHSESIIAEDAVAVESFLNGVDSAAVYANASTRFTDGGCFGLGAEIGISTQKLHVRGPFATEALTTSKYIVVGNGQVRA